MVKSISGTHEFKFDEETLYQMARRQDSLCLFLLGQTLNGDSVIRIEPTADSWCGRVEAEQKKMVRLAEDLNTRFMWGAAFVVAAGAVIKLVMEIWGHFGK